MFLILAQTTQPSIDAKTLQSVGILTGITAAIIGAVGPSLAKINYVRQIPVSILSLMISLGLTWLAVSYLQTIPGDPKALFWAILIQTFFGTAPHTDGSKILSQSILEVFGSPAAAPAPSIQPPAAPAAIVAPDPVTQTAATPTT